MSINQDIPPDSRKLVPGDAVKLKGVDGPAMVVNRVIGDGILSCVRWDKDSSKFRFAAIHRDALAYFGDPVPLPTGAIKPDFQFHGGQYDGLPQGAIGIVHAVGHVVLDPMTPVGTVLYPSKIEPVTHTRTTLETAARNLKHLIETRSLDASLMLECLSVMTDELSHHVDFSIPPR